MSRLTGKRIKVKADGTTVGYNTAWEMNDDMTLLSHYGAGAALPQLGIDYTRKRGSFTCESDPADSLQESLHEGATVELLQMYENNDAYHVAENVLITRAINTSRGGKSMRVFTWIEAGSGSIGGLFSLNGGTFGSLPDPEVQYGGRDMYGLQLSRQVFGPFESFVLTWGEISSSAFVELKTRIDSTGGERVDITLPVTSPTAWTSMYAHVQLTGVNWAGTTARNVVVEVTEASTSL